MTEVREPPGGPAAAAALSRGARREADHRIANHLTMLASYVRLKAAELERGDAISSESVKLLARSLDAQIRSLARLHRLLSDSSGAEDVDLAKLLREVCAPFVDGAERGIVLIQDYAEDCTLRADQALAVAQIAGEGIINAVKHAYGVGRSGVVFVSCLRQPAGVSLRVIDYGEGLPAAFDPDRDGGLGFRLMRDLSKALHATLRFASGPEGVRMSLDLPHEAG